MLRCGCPLLQSLGLVASSLGNSEIEHELANAQRLVAEEGCSLSESLRATTEFEARVTQLIACGESSGRLVSCLEQIAELEEEDLERQLGDALNLVEPAILVFLGATVALVTLLFFLPMTQLLNSLS